MKGVAKGVYPINTGKVMIGRDYVPQHRHYCTDAELFIQGVLLRGKRKPTSVSSFVNRLVRLFVRG